MPYPLHLTFTFYIYDFTFYIPLFLHLYKVRDLQHGYCVF